MNNRHIDLYMDLATRIALMSHAVRLKVGSVIVKNNSIISFGWNGMPSGWDNNCEDYFGLDLSGKPTFVTKPEVLHAESNAIAKLAKSTESGDGASMFITCSPCIECAKMIFQSGIKEVFYGEDYRDDGGVVFLNKCGITVKQI